MLHGVYPLVLSGGLDLKRGDTTINDGREQGTCQIVHLDFGCEEDGVVCWERVGAEASIELVSYPSIDRIASKDDEAS